jgi:hypothetical protein
MEYKFPTYEVEIGENLELSSESDGRLSKSWVNHPSLGRCLFKVASPEGFKLEERRLDWREKVAYELGVILGLPVAQTELAEGYLMQESDRLSGSLSVDYTIENGYTISLRSFLSETDPTYDSQDSEGYEGYDGYNIPNVVDCLTRNAVGLPITWEKIAGIEDGADLLTGYLLMDCWLGATDRHDENLEIALTEEGYVLCPSFDHGDSMGSKLGREERELGDLENPRLSESCWWETKRDGDRRHTEEISLDRAFMIAAAIRPKAARTWLERLFQVQHQEIEEVFNRIPEEKIGREEGEFARRLIKHNQSKLLEMRELVQRSEESNVGDGEEARGMSMISDRQQQRPIQLKAGSEEQRRWAREIDGIVKECLERKVFPRSVVAVGPGIEEFTGQKYKVVENREEGYRSVESLDGRGELMRSGMDGKIEHGRGLSAVDRQNWEETREFVQRRIADGVEKGKGFER